MKDLPLRSSEQNLKIVQNCIGEILLADDEVLIGHGDDLPYYYFTIRVSAMRALFNQIGPAVLLEEYAGTQAYGRFRELVFKLKHQ